MTPAGPVALDQEPDVREILLLADELRLDEVLAVLCVQGALQEVRWQRFGSGGGGTAVAVLLRVAAAVREAAQLRSAAAVACPAGAALACMHAVAA